MFTPPNKTASGVLQFRQYIRWVESVTDCALLDGPTDEDDTAEHRRIAGARLVCDKLRDGVVLNTLLSRVETSVGHMPSMYAPIASNKGGVHDAARLLSQARRRFVTVMTSEDLSAVTRYSGVAIDFCIHSDADVPPVEALYGGNYEAISSFLFHIFHVSVVRERFRLAPSMVQWYRSVAKLYDLEFLVPVACDCDGKAFDAAFRDGLVWIFAMHNTIGVDVDLSSVYRNPTTPEQLAANLSFAYCLMELHDIFSYFPVLDDLLERRNTHFLFMQAFHLFQRLETVTLRAVDVKLLRFAPQPARAEPTRQTPSKSTRSRIQNEISLAATRGTSATVTPRRRALSPALSKTTARPAAAITSAILSSHMPTPRVLAAPRPHPLSVGPNVPGAAAAAAAAASNAPRRAPPVVFECKIAAGSSAALQMTPACAAIVSSSKEVEVRLGSSTYLLPSLMQRGCGCKRSRGTTVGLTYSVPAPKAPPPYNTSCAPALTLFFPDAAQADAFVAAATSAE